MGRARKKSVESNPNIQSLYLSHFTPKWNPAIAPLSYTVTFAISVPCFLCCNFVLFFMLYVVVYWVISARFHVFCARYWMPPQGNPTPKSITGRSGNGRSEKKHREIKTLQGEENSGCYSLAELQDAASFPMFKLSSFILFLGSVSVFKNFGFSCTIAKYNK